MRKALVTLTKRIIIDNDTANEILKEVLNASYHEIESEAQMYGINNYVLNGGGRQAQFKTFIDKAATIRSINSFFKLKGDIPDLWDCSGKINLKTPLKIGQIPDIRVEVIEFVRGGMDKLKLAAYFETDYLILLDSISDKLLLSFPNTEGVDDDIQTYYPDTFFVKLSDDVYFKDYKIL